jgi:hypothetical protein
MLIIADRGALYAEIIIRTSPPPGPTYRGTVRAAASPKVAPMSSTTAGGKPRKNLPVNDACSQVSNGAALCLAIAARDGVTAINCFLRAG